MPIVLGQWELRGDSQNQNAMTPTRQTICHGKNGNAVAQNQ